MLYIFDLDGTLTYTLETIAHYGNLALEKNGFDAIEVDKYRYLVGDGRDVLIHRMLAESNADTAENYERVGADYDAAYNADMLHLTKPYDGIEAALSELAQNNTLAVLSNKQDNIVKYIVAELFDKTLFAAVEGQRAQIPTKPSPDGALIIADRLGFDVDKCVFVGDTNVDIFTGKAAGMKTVGAAWGFRGRDELESAQADVVIDTPPCLTEIAAKWK